MPLPKHPLTQDEVVRAEIMAMRITMTIILNAFLQEHPNRDAVLNEFEGAITDMVPQIKIEAIPPARQQAFRDAVIQYGKQLIAGTRRLRRVELGRPN
jgi:hypothetical protein